MGPSERGSNCKWPMTDRRSLSGRRPIEIGRVAPRCEMAADITHLLVKM